MKTDKIRKFLLPNIPYLFIGWAILKISTAYRMAAEGDFLTKAMGIGQTIGPAFADLAPGLNPADWLVGIVGAVGFRLLIYMKSKKAKKFGVTRSTALPGGATKRTSSLSLIRSFLTMSYSPGRSF